MKQKSRFKNFRNISYRLSVLVWPICRIGPKKAIAVDLYYRSV